MIGARFRDEVLAVGDARFVHLDACERLVEHVARDEHGERSGVGVALAHGVGVPAAGVGNPGRFWEQVCFLCKQGQDALADPLAATSVIARPLAPARPVRPARWM